MKILIFGRSDIGEGIKQLYPDTVNVPKEECDVRDALQVRNTLKKYKLPGHAAHHRPLHRRIFSRVLLAAARGHRLLAAL